MLRQIPILEPSKQPLRQPLVQPFQLAPSCVLWLLPQRDAKWYDYSGKGNHGAIHGATWKPSPAGVGMSFDSDNDYVNCGHDPSLNIIDAITIEAWINPASDTETGGIVSKWDNGWATSQYTFSLISGELWVSFGDGTNERIAKKDVAVGTGWHYVSGVVVSATNMKLYIDGVLQTGLIMWGSATTMYDNGKDVHIGKQGVTYVNGAIDGVKIYNRALSAKEIASIWRVERSWYGV